LTYIRHTYEIKCEECGKVENVEKWKAAPEFAVPFDFYNHGKHRRTRKMKEHEIHKMNETHENLSEEIM